MTSVAQIMDTTMVQITGIEGERVCIISQNLRFQPQVAQARVQEVEGPMGVPLSGLQSVTKLGI